jgi:16S rRNA (adenine1518-N6/adenine1519-N6)-dimethyltransferase
VVHKDVLSLKLAELNLPEKYVVAGNIPYYITSPIIQKFLHAEHRPEKIVLLIQKEVAERIAEKPGTKTYGILSVLLQAWYDIEYLFTVGQGAFAPPPKVQSAVIRLRRNSREDLGVQYSLFKAVVKTSFGQRRKTMRNSLKPLINAKAEREGWSEERLKEFAADPVFDLRPERLGVEEFISLTRMLE